MNNKRFYIPFLVIVALFLGTWTYTRAVGSQITVCVKKSGLVYVIGQDFKRYDCKKTDSLLSWNSEGIQGPKGEQGEVGSMGPQGPKGDKGDVGEQGPQGQNGSISSTFIVTNSVTSQQNVKTGSKVKAESSCPADSILLSGGSRVSYDLSDIYEGVQVAITESYPSSLLTWTGVGTVIVGPTASGRVTVTTYALCTN